jgi:hypothetical protein
MENIIDVATKLTTALETSRKAHKEHEEAMAKLEPLKAEYMKADEEITVLMDEYRTLTGTATVTKERKTRKPRTIESVVATSATRRMNEVKASKKNAAAVLKAGMDRAAEVLNKRNEQMTPEIKAMIETKAAEISAAK